MEERRQALGMTWAEVARDADITIETLRAIRRGRNEPSGLTKSGLDRALQWQTGSVQRVLDDKDPLPIGSLPPATAEMHGTVGSSGEEAESPITAQLEARLAQAQQRTAERMIEMVTELTKKVDESQEMIRKLLDERKGA